MAGTDLDDIIAQIDCPGCGAAIHVPYRQIKLHKAVGCSCGALIRLHDDTPMAELQALIDEANLLVAAND